MSRPPLHRAAVPAALLTLLLVSGCRATPPATGSGAAPPGRPADSAISDPLADLEATVDAVQRDLDADAAG
jgi:hypothetical protein